MIESLRNQVRGLLHTRKARAPARRGPKPAIGACIACGDIRMRVQAGFGDELWQWLQEQGWRELRFRPDLRQYRDVPFTWVTQLIDALPEERPSVLDAALASASRRRAADARRSASSYVLRN